jgi:putative glutamine amidotransferase
MGRPVIGVIGNARLLDNRFPAQVVGMNNLRALAEVAGVLPLVFAACPSVTDIGDLLDTVDGVLLTGGRANVHPRHFGDAPSRAYEPYDEARDALSLPLIEACVARGVPLFGICRGFQEMNVAFGGSLDPEIRDLPGRLNHRMPRLDNGEIHPDLEVVFGERHEVTLTPGGVFAGIIGAERIRVNSLHGQGIRIPGGRVVVEGTAEDGTIEAIRIRDASGFALGVQWHAEHDTAASPVNRPLVAAFGAAVAERARAGR